MKTTGQCRLCQKEAELQLGHVIPRFAVKWMKQTSATGYFRGVDNPKRAQETTRYHLLCHDCEQILCRDEKMVAEQIFVPYHDHDATTFKYGPWLTRFLAGLHWKVLATRSATYSAKVSELFAGVEEELRLHLLGQSENAGRAEFHLFFGGPMIDASRSLPPEMNWYFARTFDATPIYSLQDTAGAYAKLAKIMTFSFFTPLDPQNEDWKGTRVFESGTLQTPQQIATTSIGPFLESRAEVVEKTLSALTARDKQRINDSVLANPRRALSSESYRTRLADQELTERLEAARREQLHAELADMRGRDRNRRCPCGSGKKYKKCHGK
jgi:hypothetical protein